MALTDFYNTPELDLASKTAQTSATQANVYASASSLLPEKLRQAVMEKVNFNRDLIEKQNSAMAEYFATPAKAREKYQNIWNPFQREALVAEAKAQAYAPYATTTDILGARMGGLNDIINAGTGSFNAAATAAQGSADISQKQYVNLMDRAKLLANADITEREFELSKQELQERIRSNKASEGNKSEDDDEEDLKEKRGVKGEIQISAEWLEGTMTDEEIRASILSAGQDPDDSFFSDLYGRGQKLKTEAKKKADESKKATMESLASLWDKTKYWLSSGALGK